MKFFIKDISVIKKINKNLISHYFGQILSALVVVICTPIYISYLGVEAYGLVGVYAVLLAAMNIADLGLTPTINREIAILREKNNPNDILDLIKTYELACIFTTILVTILIYINSEEIAYFFIKDYQKNEINIPNIICYMSITLGLRWVEQFYKTVLIGSEDAIWLNFTWTILTVMRWGGVALALIFASNKLEIFFGFQSISSIFGILILKIRLSDKYKMLGYSGKFFIKIIKYNNKFTSSMFLGSILAFIVSNIDKIIVTKYVSLLDFGYYSMAFSLASGIQQFVTPLVNYAYPKLNRHYASNNERLLGYDYIDLSSKLAFFIVPISVMLIILPEHSIMAWTNDYKLVEKSKNILTLLAIGVMLNGIMNMPYILQLSHGWVNLSLFTNLVIIVLIVPILIYIVPNYGVLGVAMSWVLINLFTMMVSINIMHCYILKNLKYKWIFTAFLQPLFLSIFTAVIFRIYFNKVYDRASSLLILTSFIIITSLLVYKILMSDEKKI